MVTSSEDKQFTQHQIFEECLALVGAGLISELSIFSSGFHEENCEWGAGLKLKFMSQLTEQEKQNGKRKVLIPSKEIQDLMEPTTEEEFASLVNRAIPPSPRSEQSAK